MKKRVMRSRDHPFELRVFLAQKRGAEQLDFDPAIRRGIRQHLEMAKAFAKDRIKRRRDTDPHDDFRFLGLCARGQTEGRYGHGHGDNRGFDPMMTK